LVGDKVHYGAAVIWNYDRGLLGCLRFVAVHFHQFELVAMEVERVGVIRAITKDQTVTSSLLQHELPFVRIGFSVYQPRC